MKQFLQTVAQAFDFGAKARFDADWDKFMQRGQAHIAVSEDPISHRDLPNIYQAVRECPFHPMFSTVWKGPEAVGEIELPVIPGVPTAVVMLHFAVLIWQSLIRELGLPGVYGGFLGEPTTERVHIAMWVDAGQSKLLAVPVLHAIGDTVFISLAHVVLWRQEWMDAHPSTHWWWADLSTRYSRHFEAEGGIYCDVSRAWHQKKYRYGRGRFGGIDFGAVEGLPVYRDPHFKSFYHFHVGSDLVPSGSVPANQLAAIQRRLTELARFWKDIYRGTVPRSH